MWDVIQRGEFESKVTKPPSTAAPSPRPSLTPRQVANPTTASCWDETLPWDPEMPSQPLNRPQLLLCHPFACRVTLSEYLTSLVTLLVYITGSWLQLTTPSKLNWELPSAGTRWQSRGCWVPLPKPLWAVLLPEGAWRFVRATSGPGDTARTDGFVMSTVRLWHHGAQGWPCGLSGAGRMDMRPRRRQGQVRDLGMWQKYANKCISVCRTACSQACCVTFRAHF